MSHKTDTTVVSFGNTNPLQIHLAVNRQTGLQQMSYGPATRG